MSILQNPKPFSSHKTWFRIVMLVFGAVFFTMVVANHYFFRTYAFDYAGYNFAFYDYSHFHLSPCPVYKVLFPFDVNFLQGGHFSLTLIFLVPFYWLLNWLTGSYTLLLVQTLIILWSGWAVYKLVGLKTNDNWLGVGAVLYYFLLQGRYSAFTCDCNIAIIFSCLVPLFLYFFESKKYIIAGIIFALALLSREDVALWFVFIFIVLIIWHRKDWKLVRMCLCYIGISVVYFIITFKVFIPFFETPDMHYHLFEYSALGKTPLEALKFIIEHPLRTFSLLLHNHSSNAVYDGVKEEFYWVYILSGGFILFLRPQYFIWIIPILMQKMLNDEPVRWSIESYYSIQIVSLLPISCFIILAIIKNRAIRYSLAIVLCSSALIITCVKMPREKRISYLGPTVKENILDKNFFHADFNVGKINSDLKMVPVDASISASSSILPHVAQRKSAYEFPYVGDAEYLALVQFHDLWLNTPEEYRQHILNYLMDSGWAVAASDYPFLLLKKGHNKLITNTFLCDAEKIDPDGVHLISTNNVLVNNGENRNTEKCHSGKYSIKLTKENRYGFTWIPTDFKAGEIIMATVWMNSGNNKGALVASAGSKFFISSDEVIEEDAGGWKKISLIFCVPQEHADLGVYAWNEGDNDIWFDDFEITRSKPLDGIPVSFYTEILK
jgi:uncharacterized membrane protein